MRKKLKIIFYSISVFVGMLFIFSNNVYAYTQNNMDFSLNDSTKTAVLLRWTGKPKSYLYIPGTLENGYTVTEIGDGAFSHEPYGGNGSPLSPGGIISGVSIPNTVTKIGREAFAFNNFIYGVKLPDNLQSIGGWAFHECSLNSLFIPATCQYIGPYAFQGNGLLGLFIDPATNGVDSSAFQLQSRRTFNIKYDGNEKSMKLNIVSLFPDVDIYGDTNPQVNNVSIMNSQGGPVSYDNDGNFVIPKGVSYFEFKANLIYTNSNGNKVYYMVGNGDYSNYYMSLSIRN